MKSCSSKDELSTTKMLHHTVTVFDELSDDVLGNILLFCPFPAAVNFARGTCQNLRHRSQHWSPVWKAIYNRHGFFPSEGRNDDDTCDYLMLCQKKRQLLSNLMFPQSKRCKRRGLHSLSLPNRYFHFMPILPTMEDDDTIMMDPPPVYYECDSFVLTGCGTSPELLLLDPFDGSLSVYKDCLQQVNQYSNDAISTIESEFKYGATSSPGQPATTINGDVYGTVHNFRPEHMEPPIQCLLQGNEYFEVNLSDYFPHHRGRITEEFDLNYGGIEAKPIFKRQSNLKTHQLVGYVVGVARCVRSFDNDSIVCTELSTWTRSLSESTYGHRHLCRLPCHYELAELDACHSRVLVSFVPEMGGTTHTISVYPLVEWKGETVLPTSDLYFPKSLFSIRCQDAIASFTLDATGQTLLVAAESGTMEIFTLDLATAHRQQVFHLLTKLRESIDAELTRRTSRAGFDGKAKGRSANGEIHTARCLVLRRQPDLPQFHSPIQSFFVPKHLPVERSGFLTLHHNREEGSSLLLWELVKGSWEVVSLIHLRLSSRRRPYISYDGHRIIVFGEDHIGPIILVYQVLNSDDDVSDCESEHTTGEASGGVYHLTHPYAVRFANRVRHVALGGIDAFDSIHMTCNERFIIVNTRMGNHLGTSPFHEGLLVIDLEDPGK